MPLLTRRETILGGALTLLWCNCGCGAHAQAMRPRGEGCTLDPQQAEAFLATATEPQAFDHGNEKLIASTGNPDFDYGLAQTLSRLTDVYSVLPGFSFFDDYDGENAYATPAKRLQRADGTVLFGKRYFLHAMEVTETPEVGVIATCAHEFGHIVQYKHNLQKAPDRGTTDREAPGNCARTFSQATSPARESWRSRTFLLRCSRPIVTRMATHHNSRSHHGTPEERALRSCAVSKPATASAAVSPMRSGLA